MWPFRKRKREEAPTAPAADPIEPARAEWATLPALPIAVEPLELTLDTQGFEPALSTRREPELFLAPLEHEVSDEAPSGLIEGLVTVARGQEGRPEPPLPTPRAFESATVESESRGTAAEQLPPRRIDQGPSLTVSEGEQPVVSIAPPVPKMSSAPGSSHLSPPLDLRPPRTEVPSEPAPSPSPSQRLEQSRPIDIAPPEGPAEGRPTVGQPTMREQRKLGLGEPISHKPVLRPTGPPEVGESQTSEEPEQATPLTPSPEPELTLAPPTRPVSDEFGLDPADSTPARVEMVNEREPSIAEPQNLVNMEQAGAGVSAPKTQSTTELPLKPRFTPPLPKSEGRPTLGGKPAAVQRQVAKNLPSLPRPHIPLDPVPARHSPHPLNAGLQSSTGWPLQEMGLPKRSIEPKPTAPARDSRGRLTYPESELSPLAPIKPIVPHEKVSESRNLTAPSGTERQETEIEMPVVRPAEPRSLPQSVPQFPGISMKSTETVTPFSSSPRPPVETSTASPGPALSIQRATESANTQPQPIPIPYPNEQAGDKGDETDSKADEIYEKVRTRLRKEFRLYREQAGLSTYGG